MPVPVAVRVTELLPVALAPRARLPLAAVDCRVRAEVDETTPVVVILALEDRVRAHSSSQAERWRGCLHCWLLFLSRWFQIRQVGASDVGNSCGSSVIQSNSACLGVEIANQPELLHLR